MPVTSPRAKLIRKSLPKNLVSRRYSGLRVRSHWVWKIATISDIPIVIGTNKKW